MAFSNTVIAVARETRLALKLETTPGTQVLANDAGLTLVLNNAAGQISQQLRMMDDPQFRNTRSRLKPIIGSYEPGKWTFPALLKSVTLATGTPAVSELDPLWQCLFGQASTTSNDTAYGAAVKHREYALLGTQLGGTVYPSFTAYFMVGHTLWFIVGATCNQAEFDVAGNDLAKVNFSGEFMRHGFCGTDEIAAGDSSGTATALYVSDAKKFLVPQSGDSFYIQALNPTTLAVRTGWESGIKVTAVNYTTNVLTTVGAPSVGVNRVAGDLIVPYVNWPAENAQTPLYGKYGLVRLSPFVDYAYANLPATTQIVTRARVTVSNGIRFHSDMKDGQPYPTEYVVPAFRECKGELEMFFYRNLLDFNYKNQADPIVTDYVIIPVQNKGGNGGSIIHLHLPQCIWDTPNISGEDEKSATIGFRTVASTAYNNEFALVYMGTA